MFIDECNKERHAIQEALAENRKLFGVFADVILIFAVPYAAGKARGMMEAAAETAKTGSNL